MLEDGDKEWFRMAMREETRGALDHHYEIIHGPLNARLEDARDEAKKTKWMAVGISSGFGMLATALAILRGR